MIGRLTFIAALLAAPMAAAQEAPPPADARAIAAARETADRLIREGDAEGVFVNKTDSALATVEHLASGMRCTFSGKTGDRITVFPVQNDHVPRGDDVGCVSRDEDLSIDTTAYATRYRPLPEEEAVLHQAVGAIRSRWPDATPFEGDVVSMTVEGQDAPLSAAYKIDTPEGPMMTPVLVAHDGEWGYKVRATGPLDNGMMVSLYAGLIMSGIRSAAAD